MRYTTLISCNELADHLYDTSFVVFDCRFELSKPDSGFQAYQKDHIPGALYANLDKDLSSAITETTGRHPLPVPEVFADKLAQWGVDDTKQVAIYDDNSGAIAARMWWMLRWAGHEAVAVLNGGYKQWQSEGRPCDGDLPHVTPVSREVLPTGDNIVDVTFVEQHLDDNNFMLVDARGKARFTGEQEPLDKVGGHIPGAINYPFMNNLDDKGCFKSADELRSGFNAILQEKSPASTIHSCGSGVTACHNLLAMEVAGLTGGKLFPGSWSEWITDSNRPIEKGGQK